MSPDYALNNWYDQRCHYRYGNEKPGQELHKQSAFFRFHLRASPAAL